MVDNHDRVVTEKVMPTQLYLHFPQSNLQYKITPEEETVVGRMATCDVDLTRYMTGHLKAVSRQHFKISYDKGAGFVLVDISHNGTWVNNINLARGERRVLRDGDVLKLANDKKLVIEVAIEDDPDITDTIEDPATMFSPGKIESKARLYYDGTNSQFVVNNIPIPHEHLTKLEVILLRYLCDNTGRLCTFDAIAAHVWRDPGWAPGNNTISRAVGNLRKKLDQISPGGGDHIHNIRGQGYKVANPEDYPGS